tara:strand:- start:702 stop:968 length:267 start_codon:yes stop_codon:yes gene_type:complete
MKQYIYKVIIALIAVVLVYEFTLGKVVKKYTDKLNYISTKEGRKEFVISLREEINKGVKKERYLSKEDAILLNQFITKIKKELKETEN